MQRRSNIAWSPLVIGLALGAIALAAIASLNRGTGFPASSPTPAVVVASPTQAPSASSHPTQPLASLPLLVGEPASVTGVRADALPGLSGDWLFVAKLVTNTAHTTGELQVWAVPVGGGPPRRAFAYDVSLGGVAEAIGDSTPYLRRALAPQGTRMVLSVRGQLVVVDLPTGLARRLGVAGYYPSWSKDGSTIAFVFEKNIPGGPATPERHLGLVSSGGGAVRDLGTTSSPAEWSTDSSQLLLVRDSAIAIVSTTGQEVRRLPFGAQSTDITFAEWRALSPQVALSAYPSSGTTSVVVLADSSSAPATLVDGGVPIGRLAFSDPRWSPSSTGKILYVATTANRPPVAHVVDSDTGRDITLSLTAYQATWTSDGRSIAYLVNAGDQPYGSSLHLYVYETAGDRELLSVAANEYLVSVAAVRI